MTAPTSPVRLDLPGGWSGFLSESRHPGIWVANVHGADGTVSAFGVNPFDASQRAHAAVAAIIALRPRTEDVDEPEVIL